MDGAIFALKQICGVAIAFWTAIHELDRTRATYSADRRKATRRAMQMTLIEAELPVDARYRVNSGAVRTHADDGDPFRRWIGVSGMIPKDCVRLGSYVQN